MNVQALPPQENGDFDRRWDLTAEGVLQKLGGCATWEEMEDLLRQDPDEFHRQMNALFGAGKITVDRSGTLLVLRGVATDEVIYRRREDIDRSKLVGRALSAKLASLYRGSIIGGEDSQAGQMYKGFLQELESLIEKY